ncbi:MAG: relaxase/mobilization nuclease domain-containing protein, partial [Nereida ignava]
MIIKSMSRKVPSFGQLIGYIDRDDEVGSYTMRHNLMGRDQDNIRGEFEANGSLLQKRKNGVYLYHEIISISRAEGLSAQEQKDRLFEISQTYVDARCPDNMVYGGLHADKDHSYHMHLMISANRAGDAKRLRLSKAQFREIQIQTERHVLERYPELEQKVAIEKQSDRRIKRDEAELERRTGRRPKREGVLDRVMSAFEQSQDKQSLLDALGRENLELYVRGKTLGVTDLESGKNHRLKTLDFEMADRVAIRMSGEDQEQEI